MNALAMMPRVARWLGESGKVKIYDPERPTLCSEREDQNRTLRKEPVPSEAEGMGHPQCGE
jgi:hypothetical protein